jgi:hypothetical protein
VGYGVCSVGFLVPEGSSLLVVQLLCLVFVAVFCYLVDNGLAGCGLGAVFGMFLGCFWRDSDSVTAVVLCAVDVVLIGG